MKVKVSIIIPMFNSGLFIIEMIDCIIRQTYSNWELIIVDDVSTDGTYEKVINYTNNENRIKLIQRDRLPKGAQTCRNIGFENCLGEYVMFFDADDLISEICVEQRVKFMDENPKNDFGVFPAHTFSNDNNCLLYDENSNYGKDYVFDVLPYFLKAQYKFTVWTNIYRCQSLLNIKWDEKIAVLQDFDFIIQTLLAGKVFDFCKTSKFDYFYRTSLNENSISSNFVSLIKNKSTIYLFGKTLDSLKSREDFLSLKTDFLHFVVLHFERLIMDGSKVKINDYLVFCKKHYSSSKLLSFHMISNISLRFSNLKMRKAILYLLLGIRFGYTNYFRILLLQLKINK